MEEMGKREEDRVKLLGVQDRGWTYFIGSRSIMAIFTLHPPGMQGSKTSHLQTKETDV